MALAIGPKGYASTSSATAFGLLESWKLSFTPPAFGPTKPFFASKEIKSTSQLQRFRSEIQESSRLR